MGKKNFMKHFKYHLRKDIEVDELTKKVVNKYLDKVSVKNLQNYDEEETYVSLVATLALCYVNGYTNAYMILDLKDHVKDAGKMREDFIALQNELDAKLMKKCMRKVIDANIKLYNIRFPKKLPKKPYEEFELINFSTEALTSLVNLARKRLKEILDAKQ